MPLGWTDADIADLRHSIREGEDVTPSDAPAGFWQGQRDLAFRLSERVKSKRELEDLEDKAKIDVLGWLLALPFSLATAGSASDAAELQRRWANVTERANFLGDRAVVLAEAGMREEAKLQITQLDSEFPDDVWVGIKTGDAMRALGDAIETERRYREALADAGSRYDKAGVLERLIPLLEGLGRQMEAHSLERRLEEVLNSSKPSFTYDIHDQTQQQDVDANTHVATREELITTLRTQWYLHKEEIDAILADREFFQPFLRVALHQRAVLGSVPEDPIDPSDAGAVFLLMEMDDKDIIPDVLQCLRMDKQDLERAYGYVLTENFWLPFARLGSELLDELWHFITDTSIDSFARHAVVSGVIAMPHFHPQVRPNIVVFIGEILNTPGLFPLDEVAGILCECADSGLMECKGRAEVFVATMVREPEGPLGVMATREDVLKAFEEGAQEDFISSRAHDVYGVNREWQKAADRSSRDAEDEGAGGEVEWEDHDDQTGRFARTPEHLTSPKVGRNEPCPCGSGKKYKKCHGDPNTAANVRRE